MVIICTAKFGKEIFFLILDINDCMPNPCENDGNCTDGVNEYSCTCILGYSGTHCETSILL